MSRRVKTCGIIRPYNTIFVPRVHCSTIYCRAVLRQDDYLAWCILERLDLTIKPLQVTFVRFTVLINATKVVDKLVNVTFCLGGNVQ